MDTINGFLNRIGRTVGGIVGALYQAGRESIDMVIRNVERPMLEFVLQQAKGNQTAAASMLGINRNTLRRKLSEHDLL